MAWVGLVAMAAGSLLQMKGQKEQGDAAQAEANFSAGQDEQQAANLQDAALAQAEKMRRQGRDTASQARASLAASGVKVDEGSGLEAQRQIAANSESDALASILTGQRQADTLRQTAQMKRQSGTNAQAASQTAQQTSLLGGFGKVAGGWQTAAKG